MDADYRAAGRDLFDDFGEDELRTFVSGMDCVPELIRGASGSDGNR